ncbi:MAG: hypothetical protein IT567_03915, partial [Alphaproteobacteria bacterium]|nr:hypothetical protein [Alphaproteobacteria bacterium]
MHKKLIINGREILLESVEQVEGGVSFMLDGKRYCFCGERVPGGGFVLSGHDGFTHRGYLSGRDKDGRHSLFLDGGEVMIATPSARKAVSAEAAAGAHIAPMPGTIRKLLVKKGAKMKKGDPLVIMEAMKLQLTIEASRAGVIKAVCVEEGALVPEGTELVQLEEK